MFDAKSVLDGLMKATMSNSTQQRVDHALGPQGMGGQGGIFDQLTGVLGQSGGLGGLLSQLGGSGATGGGGLGGLLNQLGGAGGTGGIGGLLNQLGTNAQGGIGNILNQLGGSGATGAGGGLGGMLGGLAEAAGGAFGRTGEAVKDNNPAVLGGLGALAGLILGGRGGLVRGGLMAMLGSLAYSALQGMRTPNEDVAAAARPASLPPGLAPTDDPVEEARTNMAALLAIRAMINAAKADGRVDAEEMQRIVGELQEQGADEAARAHVEAELKRPFDLDGLVASVKDREVAVQVYAATLLAIEIDTPAEQQYVQTLAARLGLDTAVVANIHRTLGIA